MRNWKEDLSPISVRGCQYLDFAGSNAVGKRNFGKRKLPDALSSRASNNQVVLVELRCSVTEPPRLRRSTSPPLNRLRLSQLNWPPRPMLPLLPKPSIPALTERFDRGVSFRLAMRSSPDSTMSISTLLKTPRATRFLYVSL